MLQGCQVDSLTIRSAFIIICTSLAIVSGHSPLGPVSSSHYNVCGWSKNICFGYTTPDASQSASVPLVVSLLDTHNCIERRNCKILAAFGYAKGPKRAFRIELTLFNVDAPAWTSLSLSRDGRADLVSYECAIKRVSLGRPTMSRQYITMKQSFPSTPDSESRSSGSEASFNDHKARSLHCSWLVQDNITEISLVKRESADNSTRRRVERVDLVNEAYYVRLQFGALDESGQKSPDEPRGHFLSAFPIRFSYMIQTPRRAVYSRPSRTPQKLPLWVQLVSILVPTAFVSLSIVAIRACCAAREKRARVARLDEKARAKNLLNGAAHDTNGVSVQLERELQPVVTAPLSAVA